MEPDCGVTGTGPNSNDTITINVKFSGVSIPISISPNSTIKDLKSLLLPHTNVLPRGQKLIFKGKVLEDPVTLTASNLTNGSKLMLMASQGLHQGMLIPMPCQAGCEDYGRCMGLVTQSNKFDEDGPVLKNAQFIPRSRKGIQSGSSSSNEMKKTPVMNRMERWKTGVVALSECNLEAIPDEVWACGPSARVLNCNNNSIKNVPAEIARLTSLEKLFFNANQLVDKSIGWEGLTTLKYLTVLSLNHNNLTTLPSTLGSLTSLRELHVSNNKLGSLPSEIGHLTQLEVLRANNNRISIVSDSIGNCQSLVEVDFSSNFLSELPETFSGLRKLKALYLSNNGMKSLPSKLFKTCQLSTLDLHNTEITIALLRQFEGWNDFDERRRSKHQKQFDFRAGVSRDFDEGADKN